MKQKAIPIIAFFGIAAVLLSLLGCPGADFSTGRITLVISPATIPADGDTRAEISATVLDFEGNPAYIGTSVTFKTNRGVFTSGSTSVTVDTTDTSGVVKVYLIAKLGTNPGVALIEVSSNDARASGNVEITAYGPPGLTAKIDLTANPSVIPSDGKTPSVITAVLTDGNGKPVFIGTSMTFTTDKGYFEQNGRPAITVTTRDTTGTESVSLIGPRGVHGTAQIKCTSYGVTAVTTVTIGGRPVHITLTATPDSIPADGETLSLITATVTDDLGVPVIIGTEVKFEVVTGLFTNGSTTFYDATDASGVAVANFYAPVGTPPGVVQIKVTSKGASARVPVTVTGPCSTTPSSITVVASPASIPDDSVTLSKITATIRDSAGDPVCPGVPATFTSSGTPTVVIVDASVTTNASGEAVTEVYATAGGGAVETITCTSGGVSGSVGLSVTP